MAAAQPQTTACDRMDSQLREIRADVDWLREQDVAILRQLVSVKRTVEELSSRCLGGGSCGNVISQGAASHGRRLFRSATVSVQGLPASRRRPLVSQTSSPGGTGAASSLDPRRWGGDGAALFVDVNSATGSGRDQASLPSEGHFPPAVCGGSSSCDVDDDDGDDDLSDGDPSPLSRSYGAEGPRAALGLLAGGSDGGSEPQLSRTQTDATWLSSSFYEEMLRRNIKIWKTVQLINTGKCDAKSIKLWS